MFNKYYISAYTYNGFLKLVESNNLPLYICEFVKLNYGLEESSIRNRLRSFDGNLCESQLIGEFTPHERFWLTRNTYKKATGGF